MSHGPHDHPPELHQASHEGLCDVRARLTQALGDAGREPGSCELIAVSKTFGEAAIVPVIEAGQGVFGENRVQEAKAKWPQLRQAYPDITLHLIGPLQTNKARDAVALFDVIQSVDRPKIAKALAAEMRSQGRNLQLFVQVNTGAEPQKAGILPQDTDAFIALCRDDLGLTVSGLMCIPPADEEPSLHFCLLEKIAKRNGINQLSMGMSSDFEIAIEFGATHVRVGSAIFGTRGNQVA